MWPKLDMTMESVIKAKNVIRNTDAVLIGASNGLYIGKLQYIC